MYIPRTNAEDRVDVLYDYIDAHPFAALVSATDEGLFATHLPLVLDRTRGVLEGHMARANRHHALARASGESLVIVSGPDAYITPAWYPTKREHGRVVPTWNYIAVHVYGALRVHDDAEWLERHLHALSHRHEAGREHPWSPSDAPSEYIAQQKRAIVGVEVAITRLEGKWKMSQNRSAADIDGVIAGLSASADAREREVAAIVAERRPRGE